MGIEDFESFYPRPHAPQSAFGGIILLSWTSFIVQKQLKLISVYNRSNPVNESPATGFCWPLPVVGESGIRGWKKPVLLASMDFHW